MDNKEKRFSVPVVGGSSLLVIFAVLCLTVFALLSLSTVQADGRLSQTTARNAAAFYEADCRAEEILARLRHGERPANVKEYNGVYAYTCTISDTQTLFVEVEINGAEYDILRWQAVSTADWQTDDQLPVWQGE